MNIVFELAKLAKEHGYKVDNPRTDHVAMWIEDEEFEFNGTFHPYCLYLTTAQEEDQDRGNYFLASEQGDIQRWLRKEKDIEVYVVPRTSKSGIKKYFAYRDRSLKSVFVADDYDNALQGGMIEVLKLL